MSIPGDTGETSKNAVKKAGSGDAERQDRQTAGDEEDRRQVRQIVGSAELMGLENGQPDDLTPYSAAYRNTYHGKGIAYVRMGSIPGKARVCAWTESGLEAEVLLETEGQA